MSDHQDEKLDAEALWRAHVCTGEPLTEEEVQAVVAAGLAEEDDFEMRGGDLWWNWKLYPDQEE